MNSRQRVKAALRRQQTDRVPVDLSGSVVKGIHASALSRLRAALRLPSQPVKVYEPIMMLGLVEEDVRQTIGGDGVGLNAPGTARINSNGNVLRNRYWDKQRESSRLRLKRSDFGSQQLCT